MATRKKIKTQTFAPIPDSVDPNDIVMVRNGFNGRLVYISPRTQERYSWDEYGDEVEMEVRELRAAKGSQKAFFENNWFMFDDEYSWVIPYLGVTKYYESAVTIENLQGILNASPSEIQNVCDRLNSGQRESFILMVREKYHNGEIDSLKTINALEAGLGIKLTEH